MTRRLVLFDIDGTLLLSGGAGRRAIVAALAEVARAGAAVDHIRFDGKTDPQIAVELLAAAGDPEPGHAGTVARLLDRYLEHLAADLAANAAGARLLPGVAALLDLAERDERAVLGLLTGNVSRGAQLKLRAVAVDPARFRVGAYGSDHADRAALPPIAAARAAPFFGRPPAGAEVIIIGDTPADVTCGRGIGARSVGVATGSYSARELAAAGAHVVLEDFGDPPAAWRAILDGAA
jgi:phosphoglycolate phosphatase